MESMMNMWAVVEHVRVSSGAAELAIFTALLYWFFTSSHVANMLEVVGERVGGWCGRDASLRHAVRSRRRHRHDLYAKLDAEANIRNGALYHMKESPTVPAPQPLQKAPSGLSCSRCAPLSRESWQDPQSKDTGAVINILDIGRQYANGGVFSRWFYDLSHCIRLVNYDYTDIVPSVVKDERYQRAIEEKTQAELRKLTAQDDKGDGEGSAAVNYAAVRRRVEERGLRVLKDISSAMSNNVLRLVAWVCHKAIRRIAGGGCGSRAAGVARLRRAKAAGLPLVVVPLHRSHFDYILLTFALYLMGLRPPLVAAGDNMRIPFFGWFLRGCGAFFIRRRVEGSEYNDDPVYKSALRAYILNSLSANNNLEFFIEGGRTRTGKPQPPKAGILSVIMDAYLDGTIDDALLVPATLNYDRLVDGSFVREQLGMPKQMETFWSAFRGIWRTLNTNHGSIRVDFNQPISLKELVTSFQKYNYLKGPIERTLTPPNNNFLQSDNLDKQILYNHSHSSLYGADVSTDHKMMVEAIGRHLVYDAASATALMSTNVLAYVLLTEARSGVPLRNLATAFDARSTQLAREGRDLPMGSPHAVLKHAMEMLGRGLVHRSGSGNRTVVRPQLSIAASLELSYYANTVVAHYAAPAILATALESILCQPGADKELVRHNDLLEASLQLCEVLSQEFILCPPCQKIEERISDAIQTFLEQDLLKDNQRQLGTEEQQWSRRFARNFDDDDDDDELQMRDPMMHVKYRVVDKPEAIAERRRLLLTMRPLLEAYAATAKYLTEGIHKDVVRNTLDKLIEDYTQNRMPYGEAVSMDAIRNCHRILRQWGVVDIVTLDRERRLRIREPYCDAQDAQGLRDVIHNICKFNMDTPLLNDVKATN